MPFTLNGIGTSYAGRRNVSAVQGNCSFCGRFVRMSSYDTREFFCIVYIPLIPLRKFRILNSCSICRRHHRIPFDQFQGDMTAVIEPLRLAVERSPGDVEARLRLVDGLMGFQMSAEAERAAREALTVHPSDARLNRFLAGLIALRGKLAEATPFYRQAAASAPGDAESRSAFGRHLLARGEAAEAARELEQARRLDPDNPQLPYLLGQALAREKRWAEALSAFEQAASRDPELAAGRDLPRRTRECKQALGYPLTDQERKAGRWWWPSGRSERPWRQPLTTMEPRRRVVLGLGLALVGLAVIFVATALWRQRQNEVYFDNGLKRPVRVTLDGEAFPLPPGPPVVKTLATGRHTVVVTGDGGEIERATIEIPRMDFAEAIAEHRIFVYNVAAAHIYQREEIGYSATPDQQTYKQTLVGLQRFFEEDGVDYAFVPAPQSITVDAGTTTRKVAFGVVDLSFNQLGITWFNQGKKREGEKALRRAVETGGCSTPARHNLVHALLQENRPDEAVGEARKWIADCPDEGVEPHRLYQNTLSGLGRYDQVLAEYRARLDAHPEAGANHYLYGRLVSDPARSVPLYREAIRRDPQLSWAYAALGLEMLKAERDAEAMALLESSLRIPAHDPSFAENYAMAAIGAGSTAHAEEVLSAAAKDGDGEDGQLWRARWLLELADGRYDAAEQRLRKRRAEAEDPDDPELWELRLQLARARGDRKETAMLLREGQRSPDLADSTCAARIEGALEDGQYAEAAGIADEAKTGSRLLQLYAAAGLLLSGDQGAEARLAPLEAGLAKEAADDEDAAVLALTRFLERKIPAEQALAASRAAGFQYLPHAYFLFGVRAAADGDAARARSWFEKSRSRSLDFSLPYFAAAARAKG
jgi:Tfp pilus assembly protein PilF